jgi:hypothetical protein
MPAGWKRISFGAVRIVSETERALTRLERMLLDRPRIVASGEAIVTSPDCILASREWIFSGWVLIVTDREWMAWRLDRVTTASHDTLGC